MVLVDTSVWIDFFNGTETAQTRRFELLIQESEDICISGTVLTEILQGIASDKQFEKVRGIFSDLVYLETTKDTHLLSAQIFRRCRKKGITIRKKIDCMIAATCIQNSVYLLHGDRDFDHIARVVPLRVVTT